MSGAVQQAAGRTRRRTVPFRLTEPVVREHPRQRAITDLFRLEFCREGHAMASISTDISAYGGEVPGARVGRGVIAGIADMWLLYRGRAYMIEIKADDGIISVPQREMAIAAVSVGCRYGIARNPDEALRLVDEWAIPRAGRTRVSA